MSYRDEVASNSHKLNSESPHIWIEGNNVIIKNFPHNAVIACRNIDIALKIVESILDSKGIYL